MAGSRGGVAGPIKLRNPGMLLDVRLQPGASFTQVGGGGASWRGCPCCSSSRRAWQAFAVRLLRSSLCALRMLLVRAHRACHHLIVDVTERMALLAQWPRSLPSTC